MKAKPSKTYNTYNRDIINRLKVKYGLTSVFIHASLRGERNSETSIKICEDYKLAAKEVNKILNKI